MQQKTVETLQIIKTGTTSSNNQNWNSDSLWIIISKPHSYENSSLCRPDMIRITVGKRIQIILSDMLPNCIYKKIAAHALNELLGSSQ